MSEKWKLYRDCHKCPLEVFLNCLFDHQLEDLIIDGDPPLDEIQKAWNIIHSEYSKLMMSDQYNIELELIKEINVLYANIELVDAAIEHLRICFNQDLVDILNNLMLRCDLKESDVELEALKKLKGVAIRAKKLVANLQLKQGELGRLQQNSKGESGREYFSKTLVLLSKEQGYSIRERDITVYQFVYSIQLLNEKVMKAKTAKK